MRKLSLFACSSVVLLMVGAFGMSAQAFADSYWDPEADVGGSPCVSTPTSDIKGFHFGTTNKKALSTSEVYGGAALCGSILHKESIFDLIYDAHGVYKEGYILTPGSSLGGVTVRCANPANNTNNHFAYCDPAGGDDIPSGSYAGNAGVTMLNCTLSGAHGYDLGDLCGAVETFTSTYVNQSPDNPPNAECTKTATKDQVVACYQVRDELNLLYYNITVMPCWKVTACKQYDQYNNRYVMHIFQTIPNTLLTWKVWYTEIGEPNTNHTSEPDARDFKLCEFAGDPGTNGCGDSTDPWIQKNGPAGTYSGSKGECVRAMTLKDTPKPADRCYTVTWNP